MLVFDQYVHGDIDRRTFLERLGKFAVGAVTAAGLLGGKADKAATYHKLLDTAPPREVGK